MHFGHALCTQALLRTFELVMQTEDIKPKTNANLTLTLTLAQLTLHILTLIT